MIERIISKFKKPDTKPVINFYNTKFDKTVLISYITYPFKTGISFGHTNSIESLEIARVFKDLGYNVDIYDFNSEDIIDYKKYSIIFGFGHPLVNSYKQNYCFPKRIYYGTGAHVYHQNLFALNRAKEAYDKYKVWMLNSLRLQNNNWDPEVTLVDGMIILGNDAIVETYRKYYDGPIYKQPVSFYSNVSDNVKLEKNFFTSQKNFLWFSSGGAIHRSLDILIEVFKTRPDLHLHICTNLGDEKTFCNAFEKELTTLSNIHYYNFIDIRSDTFKELMGTCAYIVFPSCSEGQPSSVVNCMANGLIPIINKYAGIELEPFVIGIDNLDYDSITNAVLKASELSPEEVRARSLACYEYTQKYNSLNNFSKYMEYNLKKILGDNNGM